MEAVARYRGIRLAPGTRDFVSVPDCAHVGQVVYARIGPTTGWWTVADCSNPRDLPHQRRMHLVIEVAAHTARRQGWDHYTYDGPGHVGAAVYRYMARGAYTLARARQGLAEAVGRAQ